MRLRALAAVSVLASMTATAAPVSAADQMTLKLGGKLRHFFFVSQKDDAPGENLNTTGMFTNAEVYFDGRTVLDNGIQIRATIELEAESRADSNADEAYVSVISGFGTFRIGEKEGVNHTILREAIPQALLTNEEEVIGLALPRRTGITSRDAFTFKRYVDDALGVGYESPAIAGFRVGASYHPSTGTREGLIDRTQETSNAYDLSASYEGNFSGGTYQIAGGYFNSQSRTGFADGEEAWNLKVGLTYGGWQAAGTYIESTPASGLDEKSWIIGALYGIGPYSISADYMNARREASLLAAMPREKLDRVTLQTAYRIGPGIHVGIAGFYAEQETATAVSYAAGGLLGGVKLGF